MCGERSGNRLTREGSHSLPDLSFGAGLSTPVGPSVCQRRCLSLLEGKDWKISRVTLWRGDSEANGLGVGEVALL